MIKPGTLCIVYKVDHKCLDYLIGWVFEYAPVPTPHIGMCCPACGKRNVIPAGNEPLSYASNRSGKRGVVPARWLKPPLPLDEKQERLLEVEA